MGESFDGKLKIGNNNNNNYLIPTLMNYFNGNTITHIEIGYQFGVIVTSNAILTLFNNNLNKSRKSFKDIIIQCYKSKKIHSRDNDDDYNSKRNVKLFQRTII